MSFQPELNLYQAMAAHADLAMLLPTLNDVIVITTPTCPWCTRLVETGQLDRMRESFRQRGAMLQHLDVPRSTALLWMLRVAGHTRVPALISRSSHDVIPQTSHGYHAMSATEYAGRIAT
jgi:hypothetical protein